MGLIGEGGEGEVRVVIIINGNWYRVLVLGDNREWWGLR